MIEKRGKHLKLFAEYKPLDKCPYCHKSFSSSSKGDINTHINKHIKKTK